MANTISGVGSLSGVGSFTSGIQITGGTLYTSGGYNYRKFTSSGTLGVGGTTVFDLLIIAGGGAGGGMSFSGGGGAGGLLYLPSQTISSDQVITVGQGGYAAFQDFGRNGSKQGGNSSVGSFGTAIGGGAGDMTFGGYTGGSAGGSGGGASIATAQESNNNGTRQSVTFAGTTSQGNRGGYARWNTLDGGTAVGGGGGAGGPGGDATGTFTNYYADTWTSGNGGIGTSSFSSWGLATSSGHNVNGVVYFAGGGGAYGTTARAGGFGGGGTFGPSYAGNGLPNTGGGGSGGIQHQQGGQALTTPAGNPNGGGGSGIIIVRWAA